MNCGTSYTHYLTVPPKEEQYRVRQFIRACYRRAIFSTMNSELDLKAMFSSLNRSIHEIQDIIPMIETPSIQTIALSVFQNLDELARFQQSRNETVSLHVPNSVRTAMDRIKMKIITDLDALVSMSNLSIRLPNSLSSNHFHTLQGANEPPQNIDFGF